MLITVLKENKGEPCIIVWLACEASVSERFFSKELQGGNAC